MEDPLSAPSEFWQYLVEGGALDATLAAEFRDQVDASWAPLGQILVRRGALDLAQVMGLLTMQADEPERRIGDLAIREGMCSPEEVAAAVLEQRATSPHPVELLLRDPRVNTGGLLGPLVEYVRWLEGRVQPLGVGGPD